VKRYRVTILPSAAFEIETAYQWIAEHDEEAANRWYNGLLNAIYSLDHLPERCPLARESFHFKKLIRQILHGQKMHKYRILFDLHNDEVRVLHVRHGARLTLGETWPLEE
jgi:plasmid stabilization system protein ParE